MQIMIRQWCKSKVAEKCQITSNVIKHRNNDKRVQKYSYHMRKKKSAISAYKYDFFIDLHPV